MSQSEAISSLPTASATTISAIVKEKISNFSKIMNQAKYSWKYFEIQYSKVVYELGQCIGAQRDI